MKIEITLHHETTTENGKTVPAGTYIAEYNALQMVHGYDSSDMDRYDAIRLNQRVICRAIDDAEENDSGQKILEGSGEFKGSSCSVKLFTSRS